MKLSSQNTNRISPFEMVKDPAGLTNTDESLVFPYPFVIDKTLAKEWSSLLRDFFAIQIASQIKSANILNITSSVTSIGKSSISDNYQNPSAQLYSSLNNMNVGGDIQNNPAQQMMNSLASLNQRQLQLHNREEIQAQLNNFREFIKIQIENDPVYDNLRPIATPIIVENLLNVPLILGTKEIRVDSQLLFWILFLCLADSLELTSETTIDKIKNYIRKIPKNNFVNLLYNNNSTLRINSDALVKDSAIIGRDAAALQQAIGDNLDKYFRFLQPIFNESRWLEEVGIGRASGSILQVSASQLDLRNFQADIMSKFSNLFIGFISKDIIRILQSLVYVLVDPHTDNIDFTLKYKQLADSFITLTTDNETDNLFNAVLAGLYNIQNNDTDKILSPQNSEHMINDIETFCADLNKISIKENFDKIHAVRMNLTNLNLNNLLNFMDDLTTNISTLISIKKLITNFMIRVSNNNVTSSDIDAIDNLIYNNIRNFFEDSHNPSQSIWDGDSVPAVFHSLTGINDRNRAKGFFASIYSNLTELVSFCFHYSFIGHLCEYFKELKCKIEIKRKNALSFPNYILVIPSDYIVSLYNALAYRSFSNMVASTETRSEEKFSNIKAGDNDIGRMLSLLNNRLKIPHIIVIDSKTNTVYYKWNYLNRPLKLTASSISSYIKAQKNAIQMF